MNPLRTLPLALAACIAAAPALSACAASEEEPDAAETEDAVTSTALAPFYADVKAPELAAAKALDRGVLDRPTLFRYEVARGGQNLQIQGRANTSSGVLYAFLYDAQGHLLEVVTTTQGSNNAAFMLQPYLANGGTYFVRIAADAARRFPLEVRGLVRLRLEVPSLDLPVDACDAVPTHAELSKLLTTQPRATATELEAVGQEARDARRWFTLGDFDLRRFERDEELACATFGDGCGAWSETAPPEVPAPMRKGKMFLIHGTTRLFPDFVLAVGSRLVTSSPRSDLRFSGSMSARTAEDSLPLMTAKLGPLGFLTPNGRGPEQATTFTVVDEERYGARPEAMGAWDGIVGKDCVRLFASSAAPGAPGAGGKVHRTVLTLGGTFGNRPPPVAHDLVVNEMMAEGGSAADEFVELYNASDAPVWLDGHALASVSDAGARSTCFTGGPADVIAPHATFVLAGSGFTGARQGALGCRLGPLSGRIVLTDPRGRAIDGLGWGRAEPSAPTEGYYRARAPGKRRSLARRQDGLDSNVNATDFGVAAPSPGLPNPPAP